VSPLDLTSFYAPMPRSTASIQGGARACIGQDDGWVRVAVMHHRFVDRCCDLSDAWLFPPAMYVSEGERAMTEAG